MSASLMFTITVFGGLAFTLVTLVLYTLAHQLESAIGRHELIREARLQQQAYIRSVAERRRDANADYGHPPAAAFSMSGGDAGGNSGVNSGGDADGINVDIIEDETPAPRLAA